MLLKQLLTVAESRDLVLEYVAFKVPAGEVPAVEYNAADVNTVIFADGHFPAVLQCNGPVHPCLTNEEG